MWHGGCLLPAAMGRLPAHRALLALTLLGLLGGCGGGDPLPAAGPDAAPSASAPAGPDPTPVPSPTPTPSPTPEPTAPFAGLPVFPGSQPVAVDLGRDTWTAAYRTEASLEEVSAFYDQALPEAGWRIDDRKAGRADVEYRVERGNDKGKVRLTRQGDGGTEIRLEVARD